MNKWTKVTLSIDELEALRIALNGLNKMLEEAKKKNRIYALHLSDMQNSVATVLQCANSEHEVSELDIVFACACLYGEEHKVPACKVLRNRLEQEVFGKTINVKGDEDNDE